MDEGEEVAMELDALRATYEGALSEDSISEGTKHDTDPPATVPPKDVADPTSPPVLLPLILHLALVPQTGGDTSSAFVAATLQLKVPARYPADSPECGWVSAKGAPLPCQVARHKTDREGCTVFLHAYRVCVVYKCVGG